MCKCIEAFGSQIALCFLSEKVVLNNPAVLLIYSLYPWSIDANLQIKKVKNHIIKWCNINFSKSQKKILKVWTKKIDCSLEPTDRSTCIYIKTDLSTLYLLL